ncbi:hypothetical protein [Lysinibacillus yapensis]|uniref:hypothetical protein n=1 Tax=Ureibacillus yapensis TaxID=2304605 RepID=UPI0011C38E88|nr:hypothetical protein [Lysinibacillus yapensis]
MNTTNRKAKRHFYICLFISVLFTINLIRTYSNTGELPIGSVIFTAVVYIATLLAAWSLKEKRKRPF